MTKKELSAYAGKRFYNLSQRAGGVFDYCLTVYEITPRGTCKYINKELGRVVNDRHWNKLEEITGGKYHYGRPSAAVLTVRELEKICF